jgi:hypothetical protein
MMKKLALLGFFIAAIILLACGLGVFACNVVHAGKSDDSTALFMIGLGWCGMLAALAYTAYRDYKRGY